ncbi:MAG: 30S ribosomal protein S17 [Candidatus Colwellbacteria bacterium]|jgi:small subunit ribosomal protein S17|nr:30S ribosomal protein S17 [Candidatus Colwellbacteria bacterium]MCK9497449.1 30S ribosomal protein S17 [Candidatus Colwellbacteria bacterium]MDD3752527.1 30S ribosomal protein S17 [Candidatus Colwellbacteria bacterium]MDD4818779.1 30S ribosomal protein S17 [Candidatus Colwellbacteria bacterium]
MESNVDKKLRRIEGEVVSDKMDKTVVVSVLRVRKNAKYNKQYRSDIKFKAHDEKNEFHVGDRVVIEQTRPLSKEKYWRVVEKIA